MANRKSNRRLTQAEVDEKATAKNQQRTRRWQQIAFILISVMVLASMIITLFIPRF
jgi:hypothetical protein